MNFDYDEVDSLKEISGNNKNFSRSELVEILKDVVNNGEKTNQFKGVKKEVTKEVIGYIERSVTN